MKMVVLDGYTLNPGDLSWSELEKLGEVIIYDRTPTGKVVERSQGAMIIFTNKTPVREEDMAQLPSLKYIGVLATGHNIVNTEAAKSRGIIVTNVPGYGTASVVQLTFALLLELCHHVQRHSDTVFAGRWTSAEDWCYWDYPLVELSGKTIGIIGFGNIGRQVADVASAFGMNIIATKRNKTDESGRKNFRWTELPELFEQADVVSIHCPLLPETTGIINTENLRRMKSTAFLINTSRGPVINEHDLAAALNENIIAGAALDVLSVEPPVKDNPLFSAKNCIITPHIAWATKEARSRLMNSAIKNVSSWLQRNATNVVNL